VIRRLPKPLCPSGKNPWQDTGYKGSSLKVKEGKYKREHGRHRWNPEAERLSVSSSGALKT
jgi:hypothetical protein